MEFEISSVYFKILSFYRKLKPKRGKLSRTLNDNTGTEHALYGIVQQRLTRTYPEYRFP